MKMIKGKGGIIGGIGDYIRLYRYYALINIM
nr:MAG TPA_asm: hypothetical protein [Caudoviricetes sp.]